MLISNHVVQGALLGRAIQRPLPSFLVGVLSHFVADAIPHWGGIAAPVRSRRFLAVAVPDGLTGLALMALASASVDPARAPGVLAGALGAALPDLDKPSHLLLGRSPWPARVDAFHGGIQRESPTRMPQELILSSTGALLVLVPAATSALRAGRKRQAIAAGAGALLASAVLARTLLRTR